MLCQYGGKCTYLLFGLVGLVIIHRTLVYSEVETTACSERDPPTWPSRFTIVQRLVPTSESSMKPATAITYYDRKLGANLIQQTPDNSSEPVLWDLELDTKKSYYFYPKTKKCMV